MEKSYPYGLHTSAERHGGVWGGRSPSPSLNWGVWGAKPLTLGEDMAIRERLLHKGKVVYKGKGSFEGKGFSIRERLHYGEAFPLWRSFFLMEKPFHYEEAFPL